MDIKIIHEVLSMASFLFWNALGGWIVYKFFSILWDIMED